jgi:hypothetical protein
MRALVTRGGFATWINIRESQFIEQYFVEQDLLESTDLSERERHIAQTLVSRGVLEKVVNNGKPTYKLNINNFGR